MVSKVKSTVIEEAARVAVLECLVEPEYSRHWLREILEGEVDSNVDVIDSEDFDTMDALVRVKLLEMAREVTKEMTSDANKLQYTGIIEDRLNRQNT